MDVSACDTLAHPLVTLLKNAVCAPRDIGLHVRAHRGLIWQFTKRRLIGRYKGSHLGLLWALVNPLVMLAVYTFVFGVVFRAQWGDGPRTGGIRINGKVADGSIVRQKSGLDVRFDVTDGQSVLPVEFHGVVPDTVVDGADVVVEGGLRQDGTFVASSLLAKCPSKYEAAAKRGEKNPHADSRAEGI